MPYMETFIGWDDTPTTDRDSDVEEGKEEEEDSDYHKLTQAAYPQTLVPTKVEPYYTELIKPVEGFCMFDYMPDEVFIIIARYIFKDGGDTPSVFRNKSSLLTNDD